MSYTRSDAQLKEARPRLTDRDLVLQQPGGEFARAKHWLEGQDRIGGGGPSSGLGASSS
ncbi:hypothetical protein [Altererythrobacter sp.]|uniref:hypothetical protein n=1 Tax=Altererythrobacter sp. TaxID=1872480 RepID=UPI001B00D1EA|nr:hypothetical protein [Altererythrobacter sp.]MBO6610472.1 hypothetical protein [Altererythrobacter sp.]